jgi:hypothetical protein
MLIHAYYINGKELHIVNKFEDILFCCSMMLFVVRRCCSVVRCCCSLLDKCNVWDQVSHNTILQKT